MAMAMQGLQQTRVTANANHVNAHECETKSKTEEEALTNGNLAADEHYSPPPAAAESMEMADTSNGSKDFIANSVMEKKSNNPNQGTPPVAGVAHLHHNHHPVAASTPAAAVDHFDTSFIPSVSDIERLLPSVIQEIESVKNALQSPTSAASVITASNAVVGTSSSSSHNNSTSSVMVGGPSSAGTPMGHLGGHPAGASSSSPSRFASHHHHNSGFIPEPKRLDRDECRLNLLQHIESVQAEVEYRYSAIESAISKIEAMPGASNAGFSLEQISVGDAKMKAKLNKLIQDLSVARQLTWTL